MYKIPPHGNLAILDEAVTPTEPGEFRFNAFGESLTVMIHPYSESSLISPSVYLNISAPSRVKAGEVFTTVFSIVNDNPYLVKLPAYNTFDVRYGFSGDELSGVVSHIDWVTGASIDIEPHTYYVHKTIPLSPSKPGDYILAFKVDSHEVTRTVRIEP